MSWWMILGRNDSPANCFVDTRLGRWDNDNSRNRGSILQDYAPDDEAKADCAKIWEDCKKEKNNETRLVREMASALVDGTRYGNWPWAGEFPYKESTQ